SLRGSVSTVLIQFRWRGFTGPICQFMAELNRIYQSATALIFPSRYEGFGIPLIEAMYFGLPIICGRGGSQPEVAGDAAIYVNVEDPEDIAGAMVRLTEDRILCDQLVANGKRQLQSFVLKTEIEKLTSV